MWTNPIICPNGKTIFNLHLKIVCMAHTHSVIRYLNELMKIKMNNTKKKFKSILWEMCVCACVCINNCYGNFGFCVFFPICYCFDRGNKIAFNTILSDQFFEIAPINLHIMKRALQIRCVNLCIVFSFFIEYRHTETHLLTKK